MVVEERIPKNGISNPELLVSIELAGANSVCSFHRCVRLEDTCSSVEGFSSNAAA